MSATTKVQVKKGAAIDESADLLVLLLREGDALPEHAARIDEALGGLLGRLVGAGDFKGKRDEIVVQSIGSGIKAKRVALLGVGKDGPGAVEALRRAGAVLVRSAPSSVQKAAVAFDDLRLRGDEAEAAAQAFSEGVLLARYAFDRFKGKKAASEKKREGLARVLLFDAGDADQKAMRAGAKTAQALAGGVSLARDLGNLPGNHGQPRVLAAEARKLARAKGLTARILGRKEMEKLSMGSLLSVAKGSNEEPKLIVLEHNKERKDLPTICLVGKGLTFDSGGISLKPSGDMDKMRYDKCGGCVVIGTMSAVAEMDLPLRVVGIVPASENMPGPDANKPGDVVTASNGKTIQILNTDAEGRLILADALVMAQRFKPDWIVDLATLTGACMVALGQHCCGMMTGDDELASALEEAGRDSFERVWRLPLWEEYGEEMKGDTTDLKNLGGKYGGAITAGAFLSNFVGEARWAHLDIAGVSWDDSQRPYNAGKGATGFGVRLLSRWLSSLAGGGRGR